MHWGGDRFSERLRPKNECPGLPNAGVYRIVERLGKHQLRVAPGAEADSADSVYSVGRRLYGDFRVSNCQFFLLDTRSHRDVPDFSRPDRPDRSVPVLRRCIGRFEVRPDGYARVAHSSGRSIWLDGRRGIQPRSLDVLLRIPGSRFCE